MCLLSLVVHVCSKGGATPILHLYGENDKEVSVRCHSFFFTLSHSLITQ